MSLRLRHLAEVNPATPEFDRLGPLDEVTFMPLETVWGDSRVNLTRKRLRGEVSTGYTRFRDGDVLVPKVTPTFQAGRAAVVNGLVRGVGAGSTELHILRPKSGVDVRFLRYVVLSKPFLGEGVAAFQGVAGLQRVPDDFMRDFPVVNLPLAEQRRIADFLDAEIDRIDKLVHIRRRQLELLDESAFSRAYTAIRGVCVPGERVETGIRWLGSIPEDWKHSSVSAGYNVQLGKMLSPDRVRGDNLRPYLRCANVQWDEIEVDDLLMMDFPPKEQGRYRLKAGDLLVCEGGSWPGRSAIWSGTVPEIYYQKALHRVRGRNGNLERWLHYCLFVAEKLKVFAVEGNSSTMTHLTREQLKSHRIPMPAREVQLQIVQYLDESLKNDRALRRVIERQVDLITERRQALITAAVTGQLDVTTARGADV